MSKNMGDHLLTVAGGILAGGVLTNINLASMAMIGAATTPASTLLLGFAAGLIVAGTYELVGKAASWVAEKLDIEPGFAPVIIGLAIGCGLAVAPSVTRDHDASPPALAAVKAITPAFNNARADTAYDAKSNKLCVVRPALMTP